MGKKGVVRDPKVHLEVIENVLDFTNESGFNIIDVDYSPIKGPEGNIEYLMYIKKSNESRDWRIDIDADSIVSMAHQSLDK